jgi:mRNA-degrading endonuclease RelE of RelBE toxin-antitoxin system
MVEVVILPELVRQIQKIFKNKAKKIYSLIRELEIYPNKGKSLGHVNNIVIKELKYESFRFYYNIIHMT